MRKMFRASPGIASLLVAGCGGGSSWEPPVLPVATNPLSVATDPEGQGRVVVVNASEPRTLLGHFRAGERVQIEVLDAQWTDAPGPELFDARGAAKRRCVSSGARTCTGNGAPFMGLVLISVPDGGDEPAANEEACGPPARLFIPNGAEFTVPADAEIQLAPNDWEDGVFNNEGAIAVEVERSASKTARVTERRQILVPASSSRTPAGRFVAGEYVRFTVKEGAWNHHPGTPLVGAAGSATAKCVGSGHQCAAGEGLPMMGLVLLMSTCSSAATRQREARVQRTHIPDGAVVAVENDAHLYLAPNDWEDGFADNSGSARVRVRVLAE